MQGFFLRSFEFSRRGFDFSTLFSTVFMMVSLSGSLQNLDTGGNQNDAGSKGAN